MLYLFVLGSCIGSFIHASASRYHKPYPVRSICPICHHQLAWYHLIPVISYLLLKGHCHFCKEKISIDTWISEILAGCLACVILMYFPSSQITGISIIFSTLWYASLCDIMWGLIPDRTHVLILAGAFLMNPTLFFAKIPNVFFVFMIAFLLAYFTQGLGYGDVKLLAALSFVLPFSSLMMCLAIASTTALFILFPSMIANKIQRKTEIPFGPFLSFGAVICLFFQA